jgi:hypothetical protein
MAGHHHGEEAKNLLMHGISDCRLLPRKISKMTFDITMPLSKAKTALVPPAPAGVFVDALEVPAVYLQLQYQYCTYTVIGKTRADIRAVTFSPIIRTRLSK